MPKQSLEEWLAERKKGIGGSDAAAILSEGYGCPRALFYDKTGVEPDYQHTPAELGLFERGHQLEPLIARRFERETGLQVRRMPTRVNAERPWMRVNVDRMIHSAPEGHEFAGMGPGYLECKTANEHVFANMQQEGMPNHYVLQVQHGLAVTGWQWGYFAVLEPYTFRFLYFPYKRNDALVQVLTDVEESFWRDVQAGNIPAKLEDFNDSRCDKCQWRRACRNAEALPKTPKRKTVYEPVDEPEVEELVAEIKVLRWQSENTESMIEQKRAELREKLGDRMNVLVPGQGIKVGRFMQSGRQTWDARALDAEHPELADKYKRRGEPFEVMRFYDSTEVEGRAEALKEMA